VFVITPSGALIAPNAVDLWLNPDDLGSITERMELDLVNTSAAEVYEEQVAAHGARFAGPGLASVRVMADPSLPPGRYQLRQGQPVDAGREPAFAAAAAQPAGGAPPAAAAGPYAVSASRRREPGGGPYPGFVGHDGNTRAQPEHGPAADTGMLTVAELSRSPIPTLRLVTDGSVTETRVSGARAGRGAVELKLPGVPTISREHARFTFSDGRWWIANLGRNGLTLNGSPLAGEQPLSNGDSVRWGSRSDSLLTWVEIS
jgi:FHA domain